MQCESCARRPLCSLNSSSRRFRSTSTMGRITQISMVLSSEKGGQLILPISLRSLPGLRTKGVSQPSSLLPPHQRSQESKSNPNLRRKRYEELLSFPCLKRHLILPIILRSLPGLRTKGVSQSPSLLHPRQRSHPSYLRPKRYRELLSFPCLSLH